MSSVACARKEPAVPNVESMTKDEAIQSVNQQEVATILTPDRLMVIDKVPILESAVDELIVAVLKP